MEIIVRTDNTETVVRPEGSSADAPPAGSSQQPAVADARGATSAGPAPTAPGETGVPQANVGETEPPQAATAADQSAGAAPGLS